MALGEHTQVVASACLAVLAVLLVIAAISDLRQRRISNRLCIVVALTALPYWLATDLAVIRFAIQICGAAIIGLMLMVPFAYRVLGGGDVKLMVALALWLPPFPLYQAVVTMAMIGGLLAIVVILQNRRRIGKPTVPYGVAIAVAGLFQIAALVGPRFG